MEIEQITSGRMKRSPTAEFSVATFNLRAIMDRWPERKPILKKCIEEINADVLCFQECLTGEVAQDRSLLPDDYHIFPCKSALFHLMSADNPSYRLYARMISNFLNFAPSRELLVRLPTAIESLRERFNLRGEFFRGLRDLTIAPFFGNSVACRLVDVHEINHSTLILGKWRAVQRIEFNIGDQCIDSAAGKHAIHNEDGHESYKVWIVNTHLDHEYQDIRQEQALAVADWMEREKHDIAAIVLCGDFNGGPDEKFHSELKSLGYFSGYKFLHGMEPRSTWPTGIQAPFMDHGDAECLDYIYLWAAPGYKLQVTAADIYGNCPDPEDHSLFPSDHAAVKISMRLQKDITT